MQGSHYVVRGVDDITKSEVDQFWADKKAGVVNILQVGLYTKDVCNLRCIYCFGPDKRSQEGTDRLTLEEFRSVLDQSAQLGAKTAVYCSNGEPLMDEDLLPILEYAQHNGMKNAILTNATVMGNESLSRRVHGLATKDLVRRLYELDTSVIMSIDSTEPMLYDRIVGIEGAHEWAERAIDNMDNQGFMDTYANEDGNEVTRLLMSMVVGKMNFHEVPVMRDYAHEMHAQFVCKLPSLLGRAAENKTDFFENNSTTRWIREVYLKEMSDKKETVSADSIGRCGVWHYGIVIGNDGTIRQCFSIGDIGVGSIRETSLVELARERQEKFMERLLDPGCVTKDSDYKNEE